MTPRLIAFSLPQKEYGGLHRLVEVLHDPLSFAGLEVVAMVPAGSGMAERMSGVHTVVEVEGLETLPHPRRRPAHLVRAVARRHRVALRASSTIGLPPAVVHVFGFLDLAGPALARETGAALVRSVNSSIVPARALPVARRIMARADAGLYEGVPLLTQHAPRRGHRPVVFYPASGPPEPGAGAATEELVALRRRLGIPQGTTVIGTWSNITAQKGIASFLRYGGDVAARRNDIHFVVAGRPLRGHESYLASVRRAAEADVRLRGRLSFAVAGELDREMAFRLFDIMALTSTFEGVATATVEAMWRHVPVVAHDVGSVGDLVIDGLTGALIPPGDSEAFGRAVDAIADNPAHGKGLATVASHRVAALCSTDRLVESFLSAYGPFVGGR